MSEYLLDTNVLIAWLSGRTKSTALLERLAGENALLGVNAIVVGEIWSGLDARDVPRAESLLKNFDFWVIEYYIARMAGEFRYLYRRRGIQIGIADAILAAHAIARGATLVTGNTRDFPMAELKILRYDS